MTPWEPACVGLDPDTDPCPFCGARLDQDCRQRVEREKTEREGAKE
jgi:hypothetical protein